MFLNKFNSVHLSFISKLVDALVKLISVPLLLSAFDSVGYGIITLALSINAVSQILNLGMNSTGVKFFAEQEYEAKFDDLFKIYLIFYVIVSFLNSGILLTISYNPQIIAKNLTASEYNNLSWMLRILALFTLPSWLNQLITTVFIGQNKIKYTQYTNLFKSLVLLIITIVVTKMGFSLKFYFLLFTVLGITAYIPMYIRIWDRIKLINDLFYIDVELLRKVFSYSLTLFSVGLLNILLIQSRPVVLSLNSGIGPEIVAELKVIEVFVLFITSIANVWVNILMPKIASRNKDYNYNQIIPDWTKKITLLSCYVALLVVLNSREILTLYAGSSYADLSAWLNVWLCTVILYVHLVPSTSLLLQKGKLSSLFKMTVVGVMTAIICSYWLAPTFGIGAIVIGYLIYRIIQFLYYYLRIHRSVLKLDSNKVFLSFLHGSSISLIAYFATFLGTIEFDNVFISIAYKAILFSSIYFLILRTLSNLKPMDLLKW